MLQGHLPRAIYHQVYSAHKPVRPRHCEGASATTKIGTCNLSRWTPAPRPGPARHALRFTRFKKLRPGGAREVRQSPGSESHVSLTRRKHEEVFVGVLGGFGGEQWLREGGGHVRRQLVGLRPPRTTTGRSPRRGGPDIPHQGAWTRTFGPGRGGASRATWRWRARTARMSLATTRCRGIPSGRPRSTRAARAGPRRLLVARRSRATPPPGGVCAGRGGTQVSVGYAAWGGTQVSLSWS